MQHSSNQDAARQPDTRPHAAAPGVKPGPKVQQASMNTRTKEDGGSKQGDWQQLLWDTLCAAVPPTGFACSGKLQQPPPAPLPSYPDITVAGVGKLALPLSKEQAASLKAVAEQAPHGKGMQTEARSKRARRQQPADADFDDLVIVQDTGKNVLQDLPHQRQHCGQHAFSEAHSRSNARCCSHCYCFVCDVKASECKAWGNGSKSTHHCNGHQSSLWNSIRRAVRRGETPAAAAAAAEAAAATGSSLDRPRSYAAAAAAAAGSRVDRGRTAAAAAAAGSGSGRAGSYAAAAGNGSGSGFGSGTAQYAGGSYANNSSYGAARQGMGGGRNPNARAPFLPTPNSQAADVQTMLLQMNQQLDQMLKQLHENARRQGC